jgi:hypothetical protein
MARKDRIEDEEGFTAFLREIARSNKLTDAALGITKQVIAEGTKSLSGDQLSVFDESVLDVFVIEECERCCDDLPLSEMFDASENGGYCGSCINRRAKNDRPSS